MERVRIRRARPADIEQASSLMVRMKKLNGEFDPLFKVVENAGERARDYLKRSMTADNSLVMVASDTDRVIGFLRAEVKERLFYEPIKEGVITDFYILPEARRKSLGNEMLTAASKVLKDMGAEMIMVEFPAQNEIAVRFYVKSGFRPLVNTYAKAH